MKTVKAVCLDISGVLYESGRALPGAVEALASLRRAGLILRFVTNTATKSRQQLLSGLSEMGIKIEANELFTAPLAARQWIQQKSLRPYCLIHENLTSDFANVDQSDPNAVLLGDAREGLTYSNLNRAFQLCQLGAPLIGIGMNKYFSEQGQLMLDAGAFIRAIEWASGQKAIIMGKPSQAFFQQVVASIGCQTNECLMVGDDVVSDVQGAIHAGLRGVLVRTGKYRNGDEDTCKQHGAVIDSVADLASFLAAANV